VQKISDEERKTATLIPVQSVLSDVDDTEQAFDDFRSSFEQGAEPGTVRAFELIIDERGNIGTTKTQTRLGSWPIDAHSFDELCQMLIEQYMTPDQTRMAVRLVGTRKETTGYVFNKIVMLKRSLKKENSSPPGESTANLLDMIQKMQRENMEMFRRLQPTETKKSSREELQELLTLSQALNAPMMGMLSQLLPALAGRPTPAAGDPFSGLTGILDVAERLSEFRGGGETGGDDNSLAGILRALTPLAKPALEALPAIAAMQARQPRPAIQGKTARPNPTAVPTQPAAPSAPQAPPINPNDIPSGDQQMLQQLKPQVDSLVQMAEQKSDPVGTADLVFEQVFASVSDADYEKLADFIDNPQFLNYVKLINPAAGAHIEWFTTFQAQIVKHLNFDETQQPTPPVAPA
jgi:hypothetical protein